MGYLSGEYLSDEVMNFEDQVYNKFMELKETFVTGYLVNYNCYFDNSSHYVVISAGMSNPDTAVQFTELVTQIIQEFSRCDEYVELFSVLDLGQPYSQSDIDCCAVINTYLEKKEEFVHSKNF